MKVERMVTFVSSHIRAKKIYEFDVLPLIGTNYVRTGTFAPTNTSSIAAEVVEEFLISDECPSMMRRRGINKVIVEEV